MINRLMAFWCRLAHPAEFWPINGAATCKTCLRVRKVAIR